MNYIRGVTLIELLVYISLLGTLITVSFSVAFTLGRDQSYMSNLVERQYYAISFFETARRITKDSETIISPGINSTTTFLVSNNDYLRFMGGEWKTKSHTYTHSIKDISFKRVEDNLVNANGIFPLRASSTLDILLPLVIR